MQPGAVGWAEKRILTLLPQVHDHPGMPHPRGQFGTEEEVLCGPPRPLTCAVREGPGPQSSHPPPKATRPSLPTLSRPLGRLQCPLGHSPRLRGSQASLGIQQASTGIQQGWSEHAPRGVPGYSCSRDPHHQPRAPFTPATRAQTPTPVGAVCQSRPSGPLLQGATLRTSITTHQFRMPR